MREILKCGGEVTGVDPKNVEEIVKTASISLVTECRGLLIFFFQQPRKAGLTRFIWWRLVKDKRDSRGYIGADGYPDRGGETPFMKIGIKQKSLDAENLKEDAAFLCVGVGLAIQETWR